MYPGQAHQWNNSRIDENQALRLKQIDSLRQYFPTVKEVSRETLYEIPLTLPRLNQQITIRVTLLRDFPRVPPTLQILPPVQHKFVDSQMTIVPQAHENLSRWSLHCSLGKTVFEVIQQLMQDPPTPLHQLPTNTNAANSPVSAYSAPRPAEPAAKSSSSVQTHTPLPVIPSSFPELESKTPSELTQMLNDENEYKKFFESLACVQTMKRLRDDLRNNNEELAKRNLSKEGEVEALKRDLANLGQLANDKKMSFESKAQRQQEVMKRFSTPALIDNLTAAASDAESESDTIATRFLNGEIDQKDFIKEYMEKRKLYHLRSAKKESLMMINR